MPISYAVGYAMAQDFEECTMRELFRYADKNMYVDKNRAKIEEAAQYQQLKFRLLDEIKAQNLQFSDCLYCEPCLISTVCCGQPQIFTLRRKEAIPVR